MRDKLTLESLHLANIKISRGQILLEIRLLSRPIDYTEIV